MKNGVLFSATAGFAGALVWAAIAYFLSFELGWIAWGIGAAVGAAMMAGAKQLASAKTGGVAVLIALVSIVLGKYMAVEFAYNEAADSGWSEWEQRLETEEELMVSYIADDVVQEYTDAEKPLDYPQGAERDYPESESDYPADVWAQASAYWQAMDQNEQQAYRAAIIEFQEKTFADAMAEYKNEDFFASFSYFDLLWFALGGFTAFKLGSGND